MARVYWTLLLTFLGSSHVPTWADSTNCQDGLFGEATHRKTVTYSATGKPRWVLKAEKNSLEDTYPGISQIIWFHFKLLTFPSNRVLKTLNEKDLLEFFNHASLILHDLSVKLEQMVRNEGIQKDILRPQIQRASQIVSSMTKRFPSVQRGSHQSKYMLDMLVNLKSILFELFVSTRFEDVKNISLAAGDLKSERASSTKNIEFDIFTEAPNGRMRVIEVKNNGFIYRSNKSSVAREKFVEKLVKQIGRQRSTITDLGLAEKTDIVIVLRYPLDRKAHEEFLKAGATKVLYLMESFKGIYE